MATWLVPNRGVTVAGQRRNPTGLRLSLLPPGDAAGHRQHRPCRKGCPPAQRRRYRRPVRIVSLLPSATEILFDLGLGDDVVAVTDECDFPDEATALPVVSRCVLASEDLSPREIDAVVTEAGRDG